MRPQRSRLTPRVRRGVSPWALQALRLIFRYSAERDAWILRSVGERHGPVLRSNRPAYRPPPPRASMRVPRRYSTGPPVAALVAISIALMAGALALGLGLAGGPRARVPTIDAHTSSGSLRLSFPSTWRRMTPPPPGDVALTDEIALAPPGPQGAMLLVGLSTARADGLLPPQLLPTLVAARPGAIVTLGHARFYRYLGITLPGQRGTASLYVLPTSRGLILGECGGPKVSPSFLNDCERSLATLRLTAGTVLSPGPIPTYAAALNTAIQRLNAARSTYGAALRAAASSGTQARAAYGLAAAHAEAAVALQHLSAGPAGPANLALVGALTQSESAYRALARAASAHSRPAYALARTRVLNAAGAVTSAYAALKGFGYSVS